MTDLRRSKMKKRDRRQIQNAFSLIEIIGVLAVVAILALILAPVLIRQMDRIAGERESANLKSIGDALVQSIMRNRYIPYDVDWATNAAKELGVNFSDVKTNGRKQTRFFLIDPLFQVGANNSGLPYGQTNWVSGSVVMTNGVVIPPINPRLLILSSIGQPLTNLTSYPSASDFGAIWDWNDASTTPPTNATILSGFRRGEDLKVQRVNLSALFVRLSLTDSDGVSPRYSIDSTNWATASVVNFNVGTDGFFLKGSVLSLYNEGNPGPIDSRQVLLYNNSFVYNQHRWRPNIIGSQTIGGLDIVGVVDKFLKAFPNKNPNVPNGTDQQRVIVTNMLAYIQSYTNWAFVGNPFPTFPPGALKTTARANQSTMILSVRQLFEHGGGGSDYTPVNSDYCVPQ